MSLFPAARRRATPVAHALLGLCALMSGAAQAQSLNPRGSIVQLFEWRWTDIAKECTDFLGPKGFGAVQISPPHASKVANGWWGVYQPVNYANLNSRMGSEAELAGMLSTCHAAGVRVYADVVVNQMADGSGTATDGSSFNGSTLSYPFFSASDFHGNCSIQGSDYGSPAGANAIRFCRLGGLPDLATESSYVQGQIVNYLAKLRNLGVDGFRIDASKHMQPSDWVSIMNGLRARHAKTLLNEDYWLAQEIIPDGAIDRNAYLPIGPINEFKYVYLMRDALRRANGQNLASIPAAMGTWGAWGGSWGFVQPQHANVFINNWDTERHSGDSLNASNFVPGEINDSAGTARYELANVFMLAQGYGDPLIQSGFRFSNRDGDRPSASPYNASGQAQINVVWDFIHRWTAIANMVQFRNVTQGEPLTNWVTGTGDQVAFSRGSKGFVALNNSGSAWTRSFATGLSAGTYCNVLTGLKNAAGSACTGGSVTVASNGSATLTVPGDGGGAMPAVALHAGQKLSTVVDPVGSCAVTFTIANAATVWGENLYLAGSLAALGNWSPAAAKAMNIQGSGANVPWKVTVALPAATAVQYKYIKRNGGSTVWEGNQATATGNREFTTCAAGGSMSRSDGSFRF